MSTQDLLLYGQHVTAGSICYDNVSRENIPMDAPKNMHMAFKPLREFFPLHSGAFFPVLPWLCSPPARRLNFNCLKHKSWGVCRGCAGVKPSHQHPTRPMGCSHAVPTCEGVRVRVALYGACPTHVMVPVPSVIHSSKGPNTLAIPTAQS